MLYSAACCEEIPFISLKQMDFFQNMFDDSVTAMKFRVVRKSVAILLVLDWPPIMGKSWNFNCPLVYEPCLQFFQSKNWEIF